MPLDAYRMNGVIVDRHMRRGMVDVFRICGALPEEEGSERARVSSTAEPAKQRYSFDGVPDGARRASPWTALTSLVRMLNAIAAPAIRIQSRT